MSALIERLRRNREHRVEAGGRTFIVRRPTDLEWAEMREDLNARSLVRYVVGWEGVTEIDLYAGGTGHPVPFDSALAMEWLSDRPDLFVIVTQKIIDLYREHVEAKGAAQKN